MSSEEILHRSFQPHLVIPYSPVRLPPLAFGLSPKRGGSRTHTRPSLCRFIGAVSGGLRPPETPHYVVLLERRGRNDRRRHIFQVPPCRAAAPTTSLKGVCFGEVWAYFMLHCGFSFFPPPFYPLLSFRRLPPACLIPLHCYLYYRFICFYCGVTMALVLQRPCETRLNLLYYRCGRCGPCPQGQYGALH
jgi:hypothetical protein